MNWLSGDDLVATLQEMSEASHKCSHCENIGPWTPDEDDTWWCWDCIGKWEKDNQCRWTDGQPIEVSSA